MSVQEYDNCTYGQVICVMNGYSRRVRDSSRESWEQARHIAFYAVAPHVKPGSVHSPKNLIPMPWDIEKAAFRNQDEVDAAKANMIEKLQFRIDQKRRTEIVEKTKQRKHGRKSR